MPCLECWQDSGLEDFSAPFCSERAWNISTWQWQDSQLITMGPPSPILTRLFVEMSTSLVFACLSGRLELEDLFFFEKKNTNAKQRHLTESSRRISIVRHHFSASQRIAAYLRVISKGSETDPETSETTQTEGNSVRVAWAPRQIRPNAAFDLWRRTWAAGGHNSGRPWGRGREAIAEIPNGLASETLQNLIKLRRDQGGKAIFVRGKIWFLFFNIQEKNVQKKVWLQIKFQA